MIAGLLAGEDLRTKQFHICKLEAGANKDFRVVVASAAADQIIGIIADNPKSGEPVTVHDHRDHQPVKLIASAAIVPGAALTSDADGHAVTTTTAGNHVVGYALEAAAAANDVFRAVLVSPGVIV